jgi:hypothetical protein
LDAVLGKADRSVISDYTWLSMAASDAPWIDSGLAVNTGDNISWFVCGQAYASKLLDIWIDGRLQVWAKIGEREEIISATRLSHSLTAINSGSLKFGNYFPNDWADKQGALLQDKDVYKSSTGEFLILAIRWAVPSLEGLTALANAGDYERLISGELERLAQGDITPKGWNYLWNTGEAEIYRDGSTDDKHACIHCNTRADTGILQKDVELNLDEDSVISWDWCVTNLPSSIREDSLASHDYLSIAVEFDNGKDITYYWSSTLDINVGYECPLPNWKGKEYHVVVRSGQENLGQWLSESRNLYQDYLRYIGEVPTKIVKVWLISNSAFQRGTGDCTYANIAIKNSSQEIKVL